MNRILIRVKYYYKEKKKLLFSKKEEIIKKSNKKRVFIFLAADYGNLGDIAITYAQNRYIKEIFPDYEIIQVPMFKTNNYLCNLKKCINKKDIITIIGGGNLTNRYDSIEECRRMVIKNFRKNIIISFPQTIEFTDDLYGKESLRRTINIYKKHKKLFVFAREEKSYNYMKKVFGGNKIYLVPDIVMSLKESVVENNNNGSKIGICLRNDKEKALKTDVKGKIINKFMKCNVQEISTYIEDCDFNYELRYKYLFDLLDRISNTKCFITDRLHGMIFCYITKTPCIVFDNDNNKISESYKRWLSECNYIKLIKESDVNKIEALVEEITKENKKDIDLKRYYNDLKNCLQVADKI